MLDPKLAAFVQSGVAVIVATRDAELRPTISRGWGPLVPADGASLVLCVEADCRGDLQATGDLAATFSRPTTYRSVQIKGAANGVAEPSGADRKRVAEHHAAFAAEAGQIGVSPAQARRLLLDDLVTVTVTVSAVFDQTPGPRAGARL
jgi:hypothetical protein